MTTAPNTEYTQEVRFAVVMYGGVSLAIYINGIAQELFHLVNSTAREKAGVNKALAVEALTPTQRVYRKLSYILSNRQFREDCRIQAQAAADQKKSYKVPATPADDTIETRFVIDILSGTSAGGINAIFLSKALANEQNIDQLKELWVNEGDIGVLLNDKRSVAGLGIQNQQPPLSLLNSRRMYLKLLKAFDDMDSAKPDNGTNSRFLDESELDLFITTTDITGLPLPIRLADSVVFERRHRNVFQFKYGSKDSPANDFVANNNPFLAFAARCTSSFPFAFEPMKLSDINEVLDAFPEHRGKEALRGTKANWERFFNRNLVREADKIEDRPFGDGGYLDNKPFSFAADTIARRQANLPVDRKLIYIEPSPEHPEDEGFGNQQIDALKNVKAALLELPMYETIREDLQRLMDRNDLITRVNQITDAIEQDLEDARLQRPTLRPGEWESLDLAGMVQRFGIYYLPYRRLRIEAATDELARSVAKMLRVDEDSANFVAVRALIQVWRDKEYKDKNEEKHDNRLTTLAQQITNVTIKSPTAEDNEKVERQLRTWLQINLSDAYRDSLAASESQAQQAATTKPVKTANQFLVHFDFKYWMRRLSFVRLKIDELLTLHKIPSVNGQLTPNEKQEVVLTILNKFLGERKYDQLTFDEKIELNTFLSEVRTKLVGLFQSLRASARDIYGGKGSPEAQAFAEKLKKIELTPKLRDYLLGMVDKDGSEVSFSRLRVEECANRARLLFADQNVARQFDAEKLPDNLEQAAAELRSALDVILRPAWKNCKEWLGPREAAESKPDKENGANNQAPADAVKSAALRPHVEGARQYLWHYLSKFDDYDQVRFPIMYGTDGGESDVVEVFRISPEDAPSLIDERAESKKPNGRTKLAGTSLHHFGAFLDRVWRQNDIMWGRLDGAERLITILLPYPKDALVRDALIKEAHAAILREELSTQSRAELSSVLSEALIRASAGEPIEAAVEKVMEELADTSPVRTRLASAITAIFEDEETKKDEDDKLVTFVRLGYQVNRQLDSKAVLETISRSTQTIGGIFEDLANKNGLDGRSLSWIARLGQFFWGLVQVAVPNSILNKLATHWLYLLYMFEAVIIVGGVLLARPGAQQFGWTAFGITAIVNVITLLLRDLMRGRHVVKRMLLLGLGVLVAALTLIGLLKIVGLFGFRVGDGSHRLPPLAWISSTFWTAVEMITGHRLAPYIVAIVGLAILAGVLVLLNRSDKFNFGRSTRKPESFKPIELKKFKERDMKNIFLKQEAGISTYSVTARLSAVPPLDWITMFEKQWAPTNPPVRIYRDQVRFESDPQRVNAVWDQLRAVTAATNKTYSEAVAKRNQDLVNRQKSEKERLKNERDQKWNIFGKLS